MDTINPLDIAKRLHVKQNVTIRVIDEPTGKVVQEHVGHNAATNSLLTGIAHYLMGDGVLNQGSDTLSMWVPQYISLGTMGLTAQNSEEITVDGETYIVPASIGYTPVAPESATAEEKELNAKLRFSEYINQTPGFGADGYDGNANNNREWFGLGYPYSLRPANLKQDFYDAGDTAYILSNTVSDASNIISVTAYPGDVVDQDISDNSVVRQVLPSTEYAINQQTFTGTGAITEFTLDNPGVMIYSVDVSVNSVEVPPTDYTFDPNTGTVTFVNGAPANKSVIVIKYTASQSVLVIQSKTTLTGRIAAIYLIDGVDAVNCELIDAKLDDSGNIVPLSARSKITYRDLVPEVQSEVPNTLDVIYSAFVSVGALKDYRGDNDYIYITEAGLWSKPYYNDSGDNGMLAGYRIMPSDDAVDILGTELRLTGTGQAVYDLVDGAGNALSILSIDSITCDGDVIPSDTYTFTMGLDGTLLTFTEASVIPAEGSTVIIIYRSGDAAGTWKDMSVEANRQKVQRSILRIGKNQVAQIIWKIQLGGLEQLNGLRYLYPPQYPAEVWTLV